MPSLIVYTEETFYFEDGIHVIAKDEFMRPEMTDLNFYRDSGFWFGMSVEESLYSNGTFLPILDMELKIHGHTPKFLYSRKHLEYSYSEKQILDKIDFYITMTDRRGVLSLMEQVNQSRFLKSYEIAMDYHDFTGIRQFADSVFYSRLGGGM
ncbi:MAG: hypothetical protein ACI4FX_09970 [Agathobacter sp.]